MDLLLADPSTDTLDLQGFPDLAVEQLLKLVYDVPVSRLSFDACVLTQWLNVFFPGGVKHILDEDDSPGRQFVHWAVYNDHMLLDWAASALAFGNLGRLRDFLSQETTVRFLGGHRSAQDCLFNNLEWKGRVMVRFVLFKIGPTWPICLEMVKFNMAHDSFSKHSEDWTRFATSSSTSWPA